MVDVNTAYLNNPNLKKANIDLEFEPWQVDEWLKCAQDPHYFIENYVKIISLDEGLIQFDPYEYQKDLIRVFRDNRFVITKMPRQTGKSTTVTSFMLWLVLFKADQKIAILANKGKLANELLYKIKMAYEFIPLWMQQGILKWNEGSVELENRNKIVASSTSADSIRGESYNLVFLDEFAHVGNKMAHEFFNSVFPTISSGNTTKLFIVSTPKGLNHYYKIWQGAVDNENDYVPFEVHWSDVPGRDEEWKKTQIRNTSEDQFLQEQECEFIGSAQTLINPTKLRNMTWRKPDYSHNGLDMFEEPHPNREYMIICDVSRGIGGDYSAFVVCDISEMPYRVVAKYRSKEISPLMYPDVIYNTALNFNKAYVLVEINDIGGQVADILHGDLEYENVLMSKMMGRAGQQLGGGFGKGAQLGVRTTPQLKRIGCSNLKDLIERDQLVIKDYDIVEELSNFVNNGKGSYEADDGMHDDLVMCLVIFGWSVKQQYLQEMTDVNFRKKIYEQNMEMIEEDLLPFGFIDDGRDEIDNEVIEVIERPWDLDPDLDGFNFL